MDFEFIEDAFNYVVDVDPNDKESKRFCPAISFFCDEAYLEYISDADKAAPLELRMRPSSNLIMRANA